MAKVTVNPIWPTQTENEKVSGCWIGWFNAISRWGQNSVDAVRHLVGANADSLKTRSHGRFLSSFIRRQQDKASAFEQSIKDEFNHCGGFAAQEKVPTRVWKRHSALLVYRQQVYKQQQYYKH
jgi:hypothetical protein